MPNKIQIKTIKTSHGIKFQEWLTGNHFEILQKDFSSSFTGSKGPVFLIKNTNSLDYPYPFKLWINFGYQNGHTVCRVTPVYWGKKRFDSNKGQGSFMIPDISIRDITNDMKWWDAIYNYLTIEHGQYYIV